MDVPIVPLGLLVVRTGTFVQFAPPFGVPYAPATVRTAFVALVAFLLLPMVSLPAVVTPGSFALIVVREVTIGALLAFAVRLVMAGAEFAGELIGIQAGFSYVTVVDPQSGARSNVLTALYATFALLVFFATNAHHAMLRALVESYTVLPVGVGDMQGDLGSVVATMLGQVIVLGLRMALPVMIVLLLVEVALGLLSRVAPSLNLMMLGFPIRVVFALLTLAAVVHTVPDLIARAVGPAISMAAEAAAIFR